jgi:hypothetical protein
MKVTQFVTAPVRAWRLPGKGNGLTAAATKTPNPILDVAARVSAWLQYDARC